MHACYDCEYDSTENQGLDKANGNNRIVAFFSYSFLLLLLLSSLFTIDFPMRTGHEKAKCGRLFPEQGFPVREHRALRFPEGASSRPLPGRWCAGAGDQASPGCCQLKFVQFFSVPLLLSTETNRMEVHFIPQLLLKSVRLLKSPAW